MNEKAKYNVINELGIRRNEALTLASSHYNHKFKDKGLRIENPSCTIDADQMVWKYRATLVFANSDTALVTGDIGKNLVGRKYFKQTSYVSSKK